MTVSFVGDGIFLVALAWQVYAISNVPTALSMVTFAMAVPLISLLPIAGVLADRFDRRHIMIAGDACRGVAVVIVGMLSLLGVIALWHLVVVAVLYGIGEAFFYPSFGAVVPDIVPNDLLTEANSLDGLVRNGAERFLGPALGGILITVWGPGWAFVIDGGTFVVSTAMVLLMQHRPTVTSEAPQPALAEIREGFRYARSQPWLIATLLSACVTVMFIVGPARVLIPFIVKNALGGSSSQLGLVYAFGGAGAIAGALLLGQRGLPRRHILFMYCCWGFGVLLRLLYAFVDAMWQVFAIEFVTWVLFSWGQITWMTLMHQSVPSRLLGRVSSLDWLIGLGLFPVSLAAVGPLADAFGVRAVMFWAGVLGALATFGFLLWPGIRATESSLPPTSDSRSAAQDQ